MSNAECRMCRWEFVNHKKLMPRKSRFLALASDFEEYLVLACLLQAGYLVLRTAYFHSIS
jgi:hypothetical protein